MKKPRQSRSKSSKFISDLALFGPPALLQGESEAEYVELLTRIKAATKPLDAIEEIFVDDVTRLQWEIWRWHRLKTSMMSGVTLKALKAFLEEKIHFDLYRAEFEQELTEALSPGFPEDENSRRAADLAKRCADHEPEAIAEVEKILESVKLELGQLADDVEAETIATLINKYARGDAKATRQVEIILGEHGATLDEVIAEALAASDDDTTTNILPFIERLDHLLIVAESRRNASLREIDRYRAAFGQAVRRSMENVEDAGVQVIEGPSTERKTAA